jgi:hypothetical protein
LRSARARREERALLAVSLFDIDEPLVLLPLFIELSLLLVDELLVPEPVGVIVVLPPVVPWLVAPPAVPERDVPVVLPLERVVLLPIEELPVVPVLPACGPEFGVLLLGEPEAPPCPLALVPEPELLPDCAYAPPQARAAAAERARILMVCLMHDS